MATVLVAPRSHRSKEVRRHTLIYLGLTPFLLLAVFPILWMAITAIKQDADLYLVDAVPFWFRQAPTWKNFDFLFHNTSYGDWIVNTMAISFWVSVITLLTAVPAGYALARLRLPFAVKSSRTIFFASSKVSCSAFAITGRLFAPAPTRFRRKRAAKSHRSVSEDS